MTDASRRVLLFAPYFLPRRRVGSMRPLRFVLHLRDFGWEPTVLTIAAEGQQLTAKETRLLSGVDVVRLNPPFDRSTEAESQLGLDAEQETAGYSSAVGQTMQDAFGRVLDGIDRQFPVDTWLPFFLLRYRRITEVVRRVRPHMLWSTGDPWSGLVMGAHLKRRFRLPWVADFRDPWTLSSMRKKGRSRLTRAVDRQFERYVLRTADAVVFTAEQTEAAYRRHYGSFAPATQTIYNSYDPDVFDDPVVAKTPGSPRPAGEYLDIGFFGRFRELSPATLMIDALATLAERRGEHAMRCVRVHSFGPLSDADARHAERRGVRAQFECREAVPLERALATLRRFDLLFLSTSPRRADIVPAKLLEYLAARRPILSLSKNPEVGDILERTGTGLQLPPENIEAVAGVLARCLDARRDGSALPVPFQPRPRVLRRFAARPTTRALAALFDRVARRVASPFTCNEAAAEGRSAPDESG